MKTNELRIGNLVYEKSPSDLDYKVTNVQYIANDLAIQFIKPIPLTEEWLFKFDESITHIIQRITIEKNKSYFQTELIIGGIFFDLKTEYKIQYVHQLQNLYFALTNEELTFKYEN